MTRLGEALWSASLAFRLGRFDEAVDHLERAAALEPVDPIVNDHLGDAYWAAGRQMEARFQWTRALNLGPEAEAEADLRQKLADGLDVASLTIPAPVHIALGEDGTGEDG